MKKIGFIEEWFKNRRSETLAGGNLLRGEDRLDGLEELSGFEDFPKAVIEVLCYKKLHGIIDEFA